MVYDIITPAAMGLIFLIHDLLPGVVTRETRRMPLVEQELPTFPKHLSSHPVCMDFVLLDL